jgi:cytochrome c oxidase cbb3-type subunit I
MATAEVLRGRFAGIDLEELVDWRVVRTWLYWGMFWLIVTPSVGVTLSGIFNYPDYLGTSLGLTCGRFTSTASSSARFRPCLSANAIT